MFFFPLLCTSIACQPSWRMAVTFSGKEVVPVSGVHVSSLVLELCEGEKHENYDPDFGHPCPGTGCF